MKRIYMLSSQPMFSRGVETLLRKEPGLEIVGWESDVDRAVEQIQKLQPDVVILDTRDQDSGQAQMVMRILCGRPGTTVITLNLENNRLCIYRGEEREAIRIQDLYAAIEQNGAQEVFPCQKPEKQKEEQACDTEW